MIVEKLSLSNFRNYEAQQIEFDKNINIIYGNNAQGKTNILEAIYLFSLGKSNRAQKDREMVRFGCEKSEISIDFVSKERQKEGKIIIEKDRRKKIFLNDIPVRKNSELVGNLNVVFFGPEYLVLIKEGPKRRRKNLDVLICQLKPSYLSAISEYKKIIEQKGSLLKNENLDMMLLSVLDEKILELSVYISKVRYEYIKKIERIARDVQKEISDGKEEFAMKYISSGITLNDENIKNLSEMFGEKMLELSKRELKYRECIFGTHRDDIEFFINGKELKNFGSQGQQKTAILVQKIAEIELFFEETGEYPILLLDDIMSELDEKRQEFIINKIKKGQIFITSTDIEKFKNLESGKLLKIEKGRLKECTSI